MDHCCRLHPDPDLPNPSATPSFFKPFRLLPDSSPFTIIRIARSFFRRLGPSLLCQDERLYKEAP